jgi:hypothetical protein
LDESVIVVTIGQFDTSNRSGVTSKEAAQEGKFLFKLVASRSGNFEVRRIMNKEGSHYAFGSGADGAGLCIFCCD